MSAREAAHAAVLTALLGGCTFDETTRWVAERAPVVTGCTVGQERCRTALQRCVEGPEGPAWRDAEDCRARGLVCAPDLLACARCNPGALACDGRDVVECDAAGDYGRRNLSCDGRGISCREGKCVNLCAAAADQRSNVGCEYWAVDLDNANVDLDLNAAAQQFAVVVSNPQPDLAAEVTIELDDTAPRTPGAPREIARASVPPMTLRVFKLGPREVDGSPPGEYDTGTHTAFTRAAFRIRSDVPIIAYQFNPLENANVFSTDASLLKPTQSLWITPNTLALSYVVLGWPQTLASTDDPDTNFDPDDPFDLRAILTLVATRDGTRVQVQTSTRTLGTGPRAATERLLGRPAIPALEAGETLELELDAFDVVNLETDDFNADFTGSLVHGVQPVAVFSGSEASDAPTFGKLSERSCCADHLEEQLDPVRTAGRRFVASVSANRTRALAAAGVKLGVVDQPETFRVVATTPRGAVLSTTLDGAQRRVELAGLGAHVDLTATRHFLLESSEPVVLGHVTPSQEAAGIERALPGGDPSLVIVPPIEQFRASYVLLTPDKYAFDFVRVVAPPDTRVLLDERPLETNSNCTAAGTGALPGAGEAPGIAEYTVYTCQLGFPSIVFDGERNDLLPGRQEDGVHRILADRPVGVLVDGFDRYVSYGYAGGTDLRVITVY